VAELQALLKPLMLRRLKVRLRPRVRLRLRDRSP